MALPRQHQSSFTPREIEFLAGNETITIIPTVKLPKLDFIQVGLPLIYKIDRWKGLLLNLTFETGHHWTFSTTTQKYSSSMACSAHEEEQFMHSGATRVVNSW